MFAASVDSIELQTCWLANTTIRQDFKTSVGVIHFINEHGASYLFDDADGKILASFNGESLEEMPAELNGLVVRAGQFQRDVRETPRGAYTWKRAGMMAVGLKLIKMTRIRIGVA